MPPDFWFDPTLSGMNPVSAPAADNFRSAEDGTGPDLDWNHSHKWHFEALWLHTTCFCYQILLDQNTFNPVSLKITQL